MDWADGTNILRLAIVSDLHAFDQPFDSSPVPSHYRIISSDTDPGQNPVVALQRLLEERNLKADLLLCPGDLGDKAQPTAIQHAWDALHSLRATLQADHLVATAGNHDLDSRFTNNAYDALEFLKNLNPSFPLGNEGLNNQFWARHFAVLEGDLYRLVVLNSSAYHSSVKEIDHGRVAEVTIGNIRTSLEGRTRKPINILLCHHHPQQHMEVKLGDYDVMKNGQLLLDLLGEGRFGRWLVVHGHKHHPKLAYASGGGASPIVLSAGSLCANLFAELQSVARNQFHMVSLPSDLFEDLGCVGIIESWDWASGEGWAAAGPTSGLPSVCGFGFRGDPILLAGRIAAQVVGDVKIWTEIKEAIPEVDFVIPSDFAILKRELRSQYGLTIQDVDQQPVQIGRSE